MKKVEQMLVKPALVAGIGALSSKVITDIKTIRIGGSDYDFAWVLAGGLFLGSLIGEVGHSFVFPNIPISERLNEPTAEAFAVAATAAGEYGVLMMANPNAPSGVGATTILLDAVIAQMGADFIYNHFLQPMWGM